MATDADVERLTRESEADVRDMITDGLLHPSRASRSDEWKAGWADGFREAIIGTVLQNAMSSSEPSPRKD